MFRARRRPLMRAAMLGGAGYMVGKHRAQAQEAQAPQQAPPQPQAAAPPADGGGDLVDKLKELTDMKNSGALNDAQFEQAKAQLLGGS
jgi:hypothetical protein